MYVGSKYRPVLTRGQANPAILPTGIGAFYIFYCYIQRRTDAAKLQEQKLRLT